MYCVIEKEWKEQRQQRKCVLWYSCQRCYVFSAGTRREHQFFEQGHISDFRHLLKHLLLRVLYYTKIFLAHVSVYADKNLQDIFIPETKHKQI